jgi:hypothetical protein
MFSPVSVDHVVDHPFLLDSKQGLGQRMMERILGRMTL